MMKRVLSLMLLAGGLVLAWADSGHAIPAFARKYGYNCNMCHTAFTKLNDYGQRFRDNGYQLPGQEGREKNVFQIAPPIALRTSAGLMIAHRPSTKTTTSGFHLNGLDLLGAGVLHKNVSFLMIYTPRIDEPAADLLGETPSQPGALESASLVFSNLVPDVVNLRVGRFEPAYHALSSKRSYYLLQPYEVYGFTTPGNDFVFDDNQIGVEATGHFRNGFKYAAGVVNGSGARADNSNAKDFYVNLTHTVERGDGQSSGQRVGAFAYCGWQPTRVIGSYVSPYGDEDRKGHKSFYRLGGDVSVNWRTFNLMALMMYGDDDKALNTLDPSECYTFTGGFGRLDWAALPNNRLVASAMFNWVQPPDYDEARKIRSATVLGRYYLGDWTAVNVALHCEYTYRKIGGDHGDTEHQFAALVDFAF